MHARLPPDNNRTALSYTCTVEAAHSSHPCQTGKVAYYGRWLLIGGSFVYKMLFWGMAKWSPIGGWLLIRVAAHSRLNCTSRFFCLATLKASLDPRFETTASNSDNVLFVGSMGATSYY